MSARLIGIYDAVLSPPSEMKDKPIYAVLEVIGYRSYLIGKDQDGYACLLVETTVGGGRPTSPIRLENLDVQFELKCHLNRGNEPEESGTFTVIRCRTLDRETVRYFLSICDTIIGMLGDRPKLQDVSASVHRLAAIFQKIQSAPVRSLNGLFGELYIIQHSGSPVSTMAAWRIDEGARFDFSVGDLRLDVKTAAGRVRAHEFSFDQCNPPPGTIAVVASMFIERAPMGLTLHSLIELIEEEVSAYPELVLKLHDVIAATLGNTLGEAMRVAIDTKLTESSLRFYCLEEIPAIRGILPAGVSDVHFRSDLSVLTAASHSNLIARDLAFESLLPREE